MDCVVSNQFYYYFTPCCFNLFKLDHIRAILLAYTHISTFLVLCFPFAAYTGT